MLTQVRILNDRQTNSNSVIMKKKIKFLLRLLAITIATVGLCYTTKPGSLLLVVTLMIAIFAACAAHAEYLDEKTEDLIDKQNDEAE